MCNYQISAMYNYWNFKFLTNIIYKNIPLSYPSLLTKILSLYFRGILLLWAHKPTDDAWMTESVVHKARVQGSYNYILLFLGMKNLEFENGNLVGSNISSSTIWETRSLKRHLLFFFFSSDHLLANFKEMEKNISLQRIQLSEVKFELISLFLNFTLLKDFGGLFLGLYFQVFIIL